MRLGKAGVHTSGDAVGVAHPYGSGDELPRGREDRDEAWVDGGPRAPVGVSHCGCGGGS